MEANLENRLVSLMDVMRPYREQVSSMKVCIKCGGFKELDEFYVHKEMKDGHVNKCKECCKKQSTDRFRERVKNPEFVESEKERCREKYYRLGYREKHKPSYEAKKAIIGRYKAKYPEKQQAKNACQYLERKEGMELHHWSYNQHHFMDVIELTVAQHALLHRHVIYDEVEKMYRNSGGALLDTRQSHMDLLSTF